MRLFLDLGIGVQADIRPANILERLRVQRLHSHRHRQNRFGFMHDADDAFVVILAGRGAYVLGPVVGVLQITDVVGDLFIPRIHTEVVIGKAQGNFRPYALGQIEQIGPDIVQECR